MATDTKLISIILPVYNGENHIAESIESCLNQTYYNIELIIINDCSTDNTVKIVNSYAKKDNRVTIINNLENKKLPSCLNIGHRKAKGDLITWTSDDNIFAVNALEELAVHLFSSKSDIVYSNFNCIDDLGNKTHEVQLAGIESLLFRNCIGCCFLYKKEVFTRNNSYQESLFLVEDYDFWLRAIFHSRYFHVNKTLYNYRKHDKSLTHQIGNNDEKNRIWKDNVKKMYIDFYQRLLVDDFFEISKFASDNLTNQKIPFDWFINNRELLLILSEKLKRNVNFSNSELLEKVFLNKTVQIMKDNKGGKSNFLKSIFIIKNYGKILDVTILKILIKYSFFEKNTFCKHTKVKM